MKPISEMTFEEAFAELEEVVRKLEAGGLTLEESLALYERGEALAVYCGQQLDQAELKVSLLALNGALLPFEPA